MTATSQQSPDPSEFIDLSSSEMRRLWDAAEARREWLNAHWTELQAAYPDQFVAIKDHLVIASAARLVDLVDLLELQGLTPTEVWVEFVRVTPMCVIHTGF
jgi:hypothetical protein